MSAREPGFYWVKDDDTWVVVQYVMALSRSWWWTAGSEDECDDVDFDEIGPKIEPPSR